MNNFKDEVMEITKDYLEILDGNNANPDCVYVVMKEDASQMGLAKAINTLHNKALADKDKKIRTLKVELAKQGRTIDDLLGMIDEIED